MTPATSTRLLGIYETGDQAAAAVTAVQRAGLGEISAYAPTPHPELLRQFDAAPSGVRTFTLTGALVGLVAGFAFPIFTMLDWPMMVGGMPTVSLQPLVVIAFELTMLGAALASFIGFLVLGGLPATGAPTADDARFTDDRFGVAVTCAPDDAPTIRALLEAAGAEEVQTGG